MLCLYSWFVLVGFTVRHAENRDDESYENKGYIIDIPHILNIFGGYNKIQDFNLYLLGDEKIRKQINASIFLIKAIKGFYLYH